MHDRHRGPEAREHGDGEEHDLAEVGRQEEGDELAQVVADHSALADGGDDRPEVVVGEDDVRRLSRGLRPRHPHRDPDVGAAESGRVVDPVARDGDHGAALLVGLDESQLVGGRDAGEDRAVVELELARDRGGRARMVAREHRDADPCRSRAGDRLRGGGTKRVAQADEPEECQARVGLLVVEQLGAAALGDREHAEALARPGGGQLLRTAALGLVELGALENHLRRALDRDAGARPVPVDDRQPLAPGVERQLTNSGRVGAWVGQAAFARREQEGAVHMVAEDVRAVAAVHELRRRGQHADREDVLGIHGRDRLDGDDAQLVHRQRSGLVRGDQARRAKCLDGAEAADDRSSRRHGAGALGERDRHRRREALRYRGDRDGDSDEEGFLEGRSAREHPGRQERDDCKGECDHRPGQRAELPLEGCRGRLRRLREPRNPSELRPLARRGDDRPSAPAGHTCACEQHRRTFGQRRFGGDRVGRLLDRLGLAGQGRFVDRQPFGPDDACVGGHAVALADDHEVTGDELGSVKRTLAARPEHSRGDLDGAAQRAQRSLGSRLLDEAEDAVEDDDRRDHPGLEALTDPGRDERGHDEQRDERVRELARGDADRARALRRALEVGPERREPPRGLGVPKTGASVALQRMRNLLG